MNASVQSSPMPVRGKSAPVLDLDGPGGAISLWAALGAAWIAFSVWAYGRWILASGDFKPAPILGPDHYATASLITLRVIEALSFALGIVTIWLFLVRPWRRSGRLTLDGRLVIGSLVACTIDPLINYFHYTFAFNAHALNVGSWLGSFPLHTGSSHYGEGLVWFVPQYVYLGIGLAAIGGRIVQWQRRRSPGISNASALSVAFATLFLIDIAVEQLFIRLGVYAFPRTWKALTLFAGDRYQFPVYESIFVSLYAMGFLVVRLSAQDDPHGLSVIERGIHRWKPVRQNTIRLVAACGFCAVWVAMSYFIPWSWMSNNADSQATQPSYMLPGR